MCVVGGGCVPTWPEATVAIEAKCKMTILTGTRYMCSPLPFVHRRWSRLVYFYFCISSSLPPLDGSSDMYRRRRCSPDVGRSVSWRCRIVFVKVGVRVCERMRARAVACTSSNIKCSA